MGSASPKPGLGADQQKVFSQRGVEGLRDADKGTVSDWDDCFCSALYSRTSEQSFLANTPGRTQAENLASKDHTNWPE